MKGIEKKYKKCLSKNYVLKIYAIQVDFIAQKNKQKNK